MEKYTKQTIEYKNVYNTKNNSKHEFENIENHTVTKMTEDEKIDFVAKKILHKYRRAFEELAK